MEERQKAEIYGADLTSGRDIGPVLGGTLPCHFFPLFAVRSKDFASGNILNTQQGLPKTLNLLANSGTEFAVLETQSLPLLPTMQVISMEPYLRMLLESTA